MFLSITSILIFGVRIYKSVDSSGKMSKRTREMHRQLFYTLIFQSIIPFFSLFLPVGLLLTLPFLNVHLGHLANLPGAYISFYPAVDAGIAIFMIRDFRNVVLCKFYIILVLKIYKNKGLQVKNAPLLSKLQLLWIASSLQSSIIRINFFLWFSIKN